MVSHEGTGGPLCWQTTASGDGGVSEVDAFIQIGRHPKGQACRAGDLILPTLSQDCVSGGPGNTSLQSAVLSEPDRRRTMDITGRSSMA
jgi:hypothetical protein